MENPGIEIAWGGGPWRKNHKRVVEQSVLDATELAEYGIEMLDITYVEPKTMTIWRVAKHEPTSGVSYSSKEFDLHVPVHHIKHRKVARQFASLTMTVIHEMTHSIRSEEFNGDNLIECAATEGLAYMSEDLLSSEILLYDELSFNGERAFIEHGLEYNTVKKQLLNANHASLEDNDRYNREHANWFGPGSGIMGAVIGVNEVCRRLSEGNEFNELIHWPAEEILDITNASKLHY